MEKNNTLNNPLYPTNELMSGLLAMRCRNEDGFAERLKDDPKGVVNGLFSEEVTIDENMNVSTVDNTEDVVHVVLPDYQLLETARTSLNQEALAQISGGVVGTAIFATVSGLIAVGTAVGISSAGTAALVGGALVGGAILGTLGIAGASIGLAVAASQGKLGSLPPRRRLS